MVVLGKAPESEMPLPATSAGVAVPVPPEATARGLAKATTSALLIVRALAPLAPRMRFPVSALRQRRPATEPVMILLIAWAKPRVPRRKLEVVSVNRTTGLIGVVVSP